MDAEIEGRIVRNQTRVVSHSREGYAVLQRFTGDLSNA